MYVFVLNFQMYVSAKNWRNWMTFDKVITSIKGVMCILRRR